MANAEPSAVARALGWRLLLGCVLIYAVLFAWFYPPLAGIEDESGFINQAYVWSQGSVTAEGAGLRNMPDFISVGERRHVSWRNPGRVLTILPLVAAHEGRWIFATGALIHVATVLVAAVVLSGAGASPLWAILLLCHPTLALYSRTVMADELGGLFVLSAVAAALAPRSRGWSVGLLLGLALVTRYQAGVVAAPVLLLVARERGMTVAARAALMTGLIGAAIVAYNLVLCGRPLGPMGMSVGSSFVGAPSAELFSASNVAGNLMFYLTTLMLLWPLQLLALAVDVGVFRRFAVAVCLPALALVLCYFYRDRGGGSLEDLVLGQRLLQIALPVWIVCYALALHQLVARMREQGAPALARLAMAPGVSVALCAGLLAAQALVFHKHQRHLVELADAREFLVSRIPRGSVVYANQVLHKLFWTYPDCGAFHWYEPGSARGEISCRADLPDPAGGRYLAFMNKHRGEPVPPEIQALISSPSALKLSSPGESVSIYRLGS